MTQMVEFDLGKILERIEQNQTEIKVTLARLEGKIDVNSVEIQNVKKDVGELKTELKATTSELKTESKATKDEVSGLYKWVIGTLVVATIGAFNILLRFFDFLPKAQ